MIVLPSFRGVAAAGAGYHPTAKAIIDALSTAGADVQAAQKSAIDSFVRGEVAASRWGTSLGYLMVPVWGSAAPNAIDWVSLTSGTFYGTSSHLNQSWTPNGTTGYFSCARSPVDLGQSLSSTMLGALLTVAGSGTGAKMIIHTYNGLAQIAELQHSATANTILAQLHSTTTPGQVSASLVRSSQRGILVATREGGARRMHRRSSGSFATLSNATDANAGTLPTNPYKLARSDFAGGVAYNDASYAMAFAGQGVDTATAEAMTAAMETLYASLTGNTLPA